uniref:Lipoyl-binding domain-containing protein n=1 Tax=Glycine max TaxID=3847 RepID=A0A0R0I2Q6_SOYBN
MPPISVWLYDSHVDADTPYAEVEVMKMCMPLLSLASGIIHFKMSEGQAMQAGELIARLHLDDPSAIRKAEPFTGSFPVLGHPTAISGKVHHKCVASLNVARMILSGYDHNIDEGIKSKNKLILQLMDKLRSSTTTVVPRHVFIASFNNDGCT